MSSTANRGGIAAGLLAAGLLALAGLGPRAGLAADPAASPSAPGEQRVALGPVQVRLRLAPVEVRFGDPVIVELEVTAPPQVEVLMPVFGASLERFAILEFVPSSRIDEAGRSVAAQRYTLLASSSGSHALPPLAIEFVDRRPGQREAPVGEDAYEVVTEPVEFAVEPVVPAEAGNALRAPLGPLAEPAEPEASPFAGWVLGAGVLALAGLAAWRLVAHRRGRGGRRGPYEIAAARLAALAGAPRPDPGSAAAMDAFFVELSGLVRQYVEGRFGVHAPELTTEEFLDAAARTPDLSEADRRFLERFLPGADRVKFAHEVPDRASVGDALLAVERFLAATRPEASRKTRFPDSALAARAAAGAAR